MAAHLFMIYLDVSASVQRRAGLGRYAESLARELMPLAAGRLALFFHASGRSPAPPADLAGVPVRHVAVGFRRWTVFVLLAHFAGITLDRLLPEAELYHATEHLLLPLRRIPTVMTVHDLFFREPRYHKWTNRFYLKMGMRLFCRRATRLIAVSEYTARELAAIYGVPRERISVIAEAAAPHFQPAQAEQVRKVRRRYRLPDRYILFVGTIEPRKNLSSLLIAFEQCQAQGLTDALVVVGRRGWMSEPFFRQLAASPVREQVILPGHIDDGDLPALYTGAQAFVYPSFAEGFGLPVLEAMSCGAPVICSNTTSLPEVAGDAALLVDPASQEQLVVALRHLLCQPELAAEYRRKGAERARTFSWQRAAQETLAVYDALLAGGAAPSSNRRR